jgi:hypothetical protein
MTSFERIEAAITFGSPDRVPLCPQVDYMAVLLAGKTCADFITSVETANESVRVAFEKLGGWDWLYPPAASLLFVKTFFMEVKIPGKDLPANSIHQIIEKPVMFMEDYDFVIEKGYQAYKELIYNRLNKEIDAEEIKTILFEIVENHKKWEEAGVPIQKAGTHLLPFEIFCLHRTFEEFVRDMYRIPDKIIAAGDAIVMDLINEIKNSCRILNNKAFWLGVWRSSASFISPRQFEKFVFPHMKQISVALIEEGYRPIFHLDGDMTPMLQFFTDFPKGTCVMALDGCTDIRKAKKVVGGNMCIMGDVPPTLLCIGTEEEVRHYCKALIDDIGPGGGFIMGSGCTVPINAKFENLKTMIDVTKTYGKY